MERLPLLPLKDVVVFPRMVVPLLVGRPGSIAAVEACLASEAPVFLCTQRDASVESPLRQDLFDLGVAANVLQTLRMPDNTMKVVVEGIMRCRLHELEEEAEPLAATVERIEPERDASEEAAVLMRTVLKQFEEYVRLSQRVAPEIVTSLQNVEEPDDLADLVAAYLPLAVEERQGILETVPQQQRLERIAGALMRENEMLDMERRVRDRVREQMDRNQREHFLHEQLRAIHQELGSQSDGDEFSELRQMIEDARMPDEVAEKAFRELGRYERMPPMSPEGAILRTYIEWLAEMPWQNRSRDSLNIQVAEKVLDEDHYGLTKVKQRILEFLAVRKLSRSTKGPVLCLVGPPGVGKTSLGKSIARAMRRKFARVSLGGVRDEAEIRGHRRTYIGALPGRIIQSIRKVGVKNPVFMLDEIDKLAMDYRGDPSSALLEVLDPEQNQAFSDHYLEADFDLSEVFFITTANSEYDIPHALHDRMEVVRLSGYTTFEKERIAREFLIPKQMKEAGLKPSRLTFTEPGLDALIQRYTQEAGVRELERQVANVCRKVARLVLENKKLDHVEITQEKVRELLGPEEYPELRADTTPGPGLAVGLAWTWSGGDVLNIETITMKGKGEIALTGQLGDVMKESAQAAYTYLRAHAKELGVPERFHQIKDIHVHVPEGAIPKDGPSAGTALAVSMLSALRGQAPRSRMAMTGEITLRGRVLEVGGVKEKVIAAHRAGIQQIILPKDNEKDLVEVPDEVRRDITFHFASSIGDVFANAFDELKAKSKPRKKAPAKRKAKSKPKSAPVRKRRARA